MHTAPDPADPNDRLLLAQVHPPDWRNPAPASRYDLVVIGGGTAGLVTAAGAAGLGARVALVERHLLGGDCLNTGCVPSKSLLRSAHAAAAIREASELGVQADRTTVDFAAVMDRVRRIRAGIAPHDGAARFAGLGVDVFLGNARFVDDRYVDVDGVRLPFRRAVIATGARARMPDIPGLADAAPLTHESVFQLTDRPSRLAVLGGGPIGCELAQAFQRLGSAVTLIHNKATPLDREDPDAAAIVRTALERDGIRLVTSARVGRVETRGNVHQLHGVDSTGAPFTVEADAILIAAGRVPNVEGLGLESVGVAHDRRRGVHVDDFLRTTHPRIYACGDVCLKWKFTHAADFAARIVIQNALFALGPVGRRRVSALNMAWCTYTDPEVAHTGLTPAEAESAGIPTDTFTQPFARVDRAITESDAGGFVRIHVRRGTDRIVGATIVGAGAGDLISEVSVAIAGGIGLGRIASVIHPYPTRAEAIRQIGDQYRRTRLTPTGRRVLGLLRRLKG